MGTMMNMNNVTKRVMAAACAWLMVVPLMAAVAPEHGEYAVTVSSYGKTLAECPPVHSYLALPLSGINA